MSNKPIVVIDYGMGNLGSIYNMFKHIGVSSIITNDLNKISEADKLVLSGVGAFDNGMKNIVALGLQPLLNKKVLEDRTPILGICLGMQLFTKSSEEGTLPGLNWIDGETLRFNFTSNPQKLKVPHMGWNTVAPRTRDSLFKDMEEEICFYFVHSYHVVCQNEGDILATTPYGLDFVSAVHKANIWGTQFHPEKSHKYGMQLLKNFANLT